MTETMLTTKDNPYDPFEQFSQWYLFDCEKGYNTCSYLARIAKTSIALSSHENKDEIERAMDDIIKNDFTNNYVKLKRNVDENEETISYI